MLKSLKFILQHMKNGLLPDNGNGTTEVLENVYLSDFWHKKTIKPVSRKVRQQSCMYR